MLLLSMAADSPSHIPIPKQLTHAPPRGDLLSGMTVAFGFLGIDRVGELYVCACV